MKKNLLFSLIIFFTVFAGMSFNLTYQSQLLHYKIYCTNNIVQKKSVATFENLMADKVKNEESNDMILSFLQPAHQYKEGYKINDEIVNKETSNADVIVCGDNNKLFDNLIKYYYKKAERSIVNHAGLAGIVLVRADFEFTKFSGKKSANFQTISVSQKTEG